MNRTTKKITVSGLTLLLLGGLVSPVTANAETTNSDLPVAQGTTTRAGQTYSVGSMEMPYTLMGSKTGNVKVYWFPKLPTTLTAEQLENQTYLHELAAMYPDTPGLEDVLSGYRQVLQDINLLPGESLIDFEYRQADESGDIPDGMTEESYLASMGNAAYVTSWLLSESGKYTAKQITREELQQSYENNLKPRLAKMPGGDEQIVTFDRIFAMDSSQDTSFDAMFKGFYQGSRTSAYLNDVPEADVLKIDPAATERQTLARAKQPMTDFLKKQADGTYQLDGGFFTNFATYSSWFEEIVTPPATEKPTPAQSQPVTIHYVDTDGKTIAADKTLTGELGAEYKSEAKTISGYKLTKTPVNATGKFTSSAQSVTYTYDAVIQTGSAGATAVPKGTVIYATKKIGLYKQATFTNKARKQWYHQKSRTNRPMFVVTGYAKSKNGVKRYKVKDVNHHSKTAGKTGYVTANATYTTPVYYATKHKTVTLINPKGINAYSKKSLTGKRTHYQQGQVLKVKKIVSHNLTTRFVLSNGRYITANKQLVQAGKQQRAKTIRVQRGINRYQTANLTKKNGHYRRGTVLKVKGWTYSNANNFGKGDTLRYQVSGGYVTANGTYVRSIQ